MSCDAPPDNEHYKAGNTNPDGSYKVGKNKPPQSGKFRAGDGRPRGRRKKGTKNLATDFSEELSSKVTLKVDGKPRRVTKQRAIMMRLMDNASRGQTAAIKTIMAYAEKFGIEVELGEEREEPDSAYPHLNKLTEYEFELLTMLLEKASGESLTAEDNDGKLYDPSHPLAYLEDPDDPRNSYLDSTIEGVVWRRFHGSRFSDFIYEMRSHAYDSAALPRKKRQAIDANQKGEK